MVQFHPPDELLLGYAAGSLSEPWSVLVATHLTLCPDCRLVAADLDEIGGLVIEDVSPVAMSPAALTSVMAAVAEASYVDGVQDAPAVFPFLDLAVGDPPLPRPLASYLGRAGTPQGWRTLLPGVQEIALPAHAASGRPSLMRIRPGFPVPQHTHVGSEAIILLAGGFSDGLGDYRRGDVSFADGRHEHRPVAHRDAVCLCFIVTDAPVRFTGVIGRLLNVFNRP